MRGEITGERQVCSTLHHIGTSPCKAWGGAIPAGQMKKPQLRSNIKQRKENWNTQKRERNENAWIWAGSWVRGKEATRWVTAVATAVDRGGHQNIQNCWISCFSPWLFTLSLIPANGNGKLYLNCHYLFSIINVTQVNEGKYMQVYCREMYT